MACIIGYFQFLIVILVWSLFWEDLSHFTGVYRDGKALRGVMGLKTYELMISCIIIIIIYTHAHAHTSIHIVFCYSFGIVILQLFTAWTSRKRELKGQFHDQE